MVLWFLKTPSRPNQKKIETLFLFLVEDISKQQHHNKSKMATSILQGDMSEVAKQHFTNNYANKNIAVVGDNTIRTKADNSIITEKSLKRNGQVLRKGKYFCGCGFIITSSNGENKGVKNMEVKLRLHKKVCPEEKK